MVDKLIRQIAAERGKISGIGREINHLKILRGIDTYKATNPTCFFVNMYCFRFVFNQDKEVSLLKYFIHIKS